MNLISDVSFLYKPNERTVMVDAEEAVRLEGSFREDLSQQVCQNTIANFLFGRGLSTLPHKGTKFEGSTEMNTLLNKEWTPVLLNVLEHFHIYGYVVYVIIKSKTMYGYKNVLIPKVLDRQLYDLVITTKSDYSVEYNVILKPIGDGSKNSKTKTYLAFFKGGEPHAYTGKHQSICSRLYSSYVQFSHIMEMNSVALQQLSHPPIMLQRDVEILKQYENPKDGPSSATITLANSSGGLMRETADTIFNGDILDGTQSIYALNQLQSVEAEGQNKPSRALNDDILEENLVYGKKRRLMHSQTPEDNIHFIPIGYKMATPQQVQPIEVKETFRYIENYRDYVFALYQIPVGICFPNLNAKSGSSTTVHLDDSDKQWFTRTLRDRQEQLIGLTETFYTIIYGVTDMEFEIILPLVPNANISQIFSLMDQNIIDEATGKKLILDSSGIELSLLFNGKNKNDRPRPFGSEKTTSGLLQATIDETNADVELKTAQAKKILAEIGSIKADAAKTGAETTQIKKGVDLSGPSN